MADEEEAFSACLQALRKLLQSGILPPDIEEQMKKLSDSIEKIIDHEKPIQRKKNVRTWIRQLEDVAYEIDEILHLKSPKGESNEVPSTLRSNSKTSNVCNRGVKQRIGQPADLKAIMMSLDKISRKLNSPSLQPNTDQHDITKISIIHSPVESFTLSGKKEDQEKIIDLLLSVKPTVQVGGPCIIPTAAVRENCEATTTIKAAQAIYNDKRVVNHFRRRIWVNASLLINFGKLSELCQKQTSTLFWIHKTLNYDLEEELVLIVFYYIKKESIDPEVRYLHVRETKCEVTITTPLPLRRYWGEPKRNDTIDTINWEERYSPLESWIAFKQCITVCANGCKNHCMNLELEKIGRNIVKKLGGSPSMIRTIGYILSLTREPSFWRMVSESEIWKLPVKEIALYRIIELCFNSRPQKSWLQDCKHYLNKPPCLRPWYLWPDDLQHDNKSRKLIDKQKLLPSHQAHSFIAIGGRRSRSFVQECSRSLQS